MDERQRESHHYGKVPDLADAWGGFRSGADYCAATMVELDTDGESR